MARVTAICLSQAVQDRLSLLTWHEVAIAAHPTQDELLLALDRAVA
jgi:uroporphyrinogen-III synthase